MFIDLDLEEAMFISESKNRFICTVLIKNEVVECYVPSSSKLNKYVNLKNKGVLISRNKNSKGRTLYSLFAVKYYGKYILLNLNMVNKLLGSYLKSQKGIEIKFEGYISNYKADLLVTDLQTVQETIIEAKGIIATSRSIQFPLINSQRAISQLYTLKSLLKEGHPISYYLVSLSPIVQTITLDQTHHEYYTLLVECIDLGLKLNGVSIHYNGNSFKFNKIKIIF
ncbi:DNA/RNA nuclease SfsA [Aneurinibacillus aneurinilyticus]|uniref:DNA/RNA nuclease SfsA n=1 Tax=Aneurinibacillus aneurinilyticus TaxID=1391 RepID=UPI002E239E6B|nr:DNA/RNA nuclease SfsA [Aneurinibacillus aneurinilyticus]